MIACVAALVRVIAQKICGTVRRSFHVEQVQSPLSDGCSSSCAQLIVRPSRRGGVPVLSRAIGRSATRSCCTSLCAPASPMRPPSIRSSPRNTLPPRQVPVARPTPPPPRPPPCPTTPPPTHHPPHHTHTAT